MELNGQECGGRRLKIEQVASRNNAGRERGTFETKGDIFEAFVGNISFDATEEDLNAFFEPCGNLIKVKLLRGKAFVKFST